MKMSVLSSSGAVTTAEPAGRDWTFDEWSAGFDIHLGVYSDLIDVLSNLNDHEKERSGGGRS